MKAPDFKYVKPAGVQEALALLAEYGDDARLLAGGQSLLASLNMRLSVPEILIDIGGLAELCGIRVDADQLRIGAMTRHVEVQQSALVARHAPLLSEAIGHVAHAAIRNRGTLGGNLAQADPASEMPACAIALDASFVLIGTAGERCVPAREFYKDLYATDLQAGELLAAVNYPLAGSDHVYGFRELVRRRGDFAAVGVAWSGTVSNKLLQEITLVFFAVGNTPVLARQTAAVLAGGPVTASVIAEARQILAQELDVIGDTYTSAAMKRYLAGYFLEASLKHELWVAS